MLFWEIALFIMPLFRNAHQVLTLLQQGLLFY